MVSRHFMKKGEREGGGKRSKKHYSQNSSTVFSYITYYLLLPSKNFITPLVGYCNSLRENNFKKIKLKIYIFPQRILCYFYKINNKLRRDCYFDYYLINNFILFFISVPGRQFAHLTHKLYEFSSLDRVSYTLTITVSINGILSAITLHIATIQITSNNGWYLSCGLYRRFAGQEYERERRGGGVGESNR